MRPAIAWVMLAMASNAAPCGKRTVTNQAPVAYPVHDIQEGACISMDGETIIFRSDRQARRQPARTAPVAPRAASYDPYPPSQPPAPSPAAERISRLETAIERLEGALTHLESMLVTRRHEHEPATSVATVEQDEPPVRILRMEQVGQGQPSEPAYVRPDVKVSVYTGGGATAILGQARIKAAD